MQPDDQKAIIDREKQRLIEMIPDAIDCIARCLGPKPPRNAQTGLSAAKTVLDRGGLPAVASTEITGKDGGSLTITMTPAETLRARRQERLKEQDSSKPEDPQD